MKKGKPAPFAGNLMSDAALAKLVTDAKKTLNLCKLDSSKLKLDLVAEKKSNKVICQAKITAEQSKLTACKDDRKRQGQIYEAALKKCSKDQPWFRSPFFGYIMGNVVAGGVCAAVSAGK